MAWDELSQLLESYASQDRQQAIDGFLDAVSGPLPPPVLAVNVVHALEVLGEVHQAHSLCERLNQAHPQFAAGWARRSQLAFTAGHKDQALAMAAHAVALDPNCAFSRSCHAYLLRSSGRVTDATSETSIALKLAPDNPVAWSHYGLCLSDQSQHEMAMNALHRAIELEPDKPVHWSNWLMTGQYDPAATSDVLIQQARRFARHFEEVPRTMAPAGGSTLRVAYLGSDFYSHPVGWFFLPIIEAHDKDSVEIWVLHDGRQSDHLTDQIRDRAHRFINSGGMDDAALSELLQEQRIDVLVDLAGHTGGNRLVAMSRRLAPVQLSWLGYSGSTGLVNIDAVVLGEAHCTPATQSFFVEPLSTVPGTHLVYRPPRYAPPLAYRAAQEVRFASFNNTAKLNTEVMACWADVLEQVPGSRLTLKWRSLADPRYAQHIRARFQNLGLSPARLSLEPASEHQSMLDQYNEVDVALDPFPFSGGLTTFEALSMGVPVVTLAWERPLSRQGAAILNALGLSELVTDNAGDYRRAAVALAEDAGRRAELRRTLPATVVTHCEQHAPRVAAGLEAIYRSLLAELTS
jgi:predicted O-linked N-acetylglucosamine transferase (SPINDLY family)